MSTAETFQRNRPRLLSLAYRMLGSMAEAEDAVQEAWLRWTGADTSRIESPDAWLTATVSRLCVDQLRAAQVRRADYPGPWLPEPVHTGEPPDTASISLAFLVLLESLTPDERAAYLLHEIFDYSHAEVATFLGKEEAACRQLAHRARQRVQEGRPRFAPSREQHQRILGAFFQAALQGDLTGMKQVLAEDATLWTDGGGRVRGAASKPVHGAEAIARLFQLLSQRFPESAGLRYGMEEVNGWPAIVGRTDGAASFVLTTETDGTKILALRAVLNPEKLRLAPLA
ncbi:sigma-70 family RNA polymerase sigma factor [Aggregicoccus sp. 17bor-14]|uniref:RNA polymerase sigma factor SigJ n=1 Tax=Myxococcaceae TaxID=31 RepID=UPI00129CB5A1|nr:MULTISPECIES: RNA polymerase sigma factor SigJ [Myxococcaceae]MBF5044056.1 RNA polymerase sigma factor SigJ [Simulacricoccus sp. 17bor-14]MRI89807.1 sigma-70 family RNA polymerase sigma factor [Aggregicoccus sp. 17bor-14]